MKIVILAFHKNKLIFFFFFLASNIFFCIKFGIKLKRDIAKISKYKNHFYGSILQGRYLKKPSNSIHWRWGVSVKLLAYNLQLEPLSLTTIAVQNSGFGNFKFCSKICVSGWVQLHAPIKSLKFKVNDFKLKINN